MGSALRGRPSWDQFDDLTSMAARDAGPMLWTRTDLRPADVDGAELDDHFSFIALAWLEALGFCGKGESARRICLLGIPARSDGRSKASQDQHPKRMLIRERRARCASAGIRTKRAARPRPALEAGRREGGSRTGRCGTRVAGERRPPSGAPGSR